MPIKAYWTAKQRTVYGVNLVSHKGRVIWLWWRYSPG